MNGYQRGTFCMLVMACGIVAGLIFAEPICRYLKSKKNVAVRVDQKTKVIEKIEVTRLEAPDVITGQFFSFFSADVAETIDETHILFTRPQLIEIDPKTNRIMSKMTADQAVMELRQPGSLSMDYKSIRWRGNFQYRHFQPEYKAKGDGNDAARTSSGSGDSDRSGEHAADDTGR